MNIGLKYGLLIFCIGLGISVSIPAIGQCEDTLLEKAILKSGNDALFIREFLVKNYSKARKNRTKTPAISSRFNIRLNKGIIYRFVVEKEENSLAEAFLQLRDNNLLLASTFDTENHKNNYSFDYLCNESGPYQVIMSFVDENYGCAVGAMFAIVKDSLSLASIIDSAEIQNVLYTDTDNFVDIAASDIPGGSLDVSVSRGSIIREAGLYKIRVDEPGNLTLNVVAKDKNGHITETFKSAFVVMNPMLPTVSFLSSTGGLIKKQDILLSNLQLAIHNYRSDVQFKIKNFTITKSLSSTGISSDSGNRLNFRQLNLIKELESGDTFYINNIEIEDSKGRIYQVFPLGFIISD